MDNGQKGFLEVLVKTIDDKVKFSSTSRSNPEIITDYFPPFGNAEGYTSLELLLISLSTCLSTSVLTLVRMRMNKRIDSLVIKATGQMREEHPKVFEHIFIEMEIISPDVEEAEISRAIAASEEKICPVWAMLKGNVEVSVSFLLRRT